jgi:hypothetical protein
MKTICDRRNSIMKKGLRVKNEFYTNNEDQFHKAYRFNYVSIHG